MHPDTFNVKINLYLIIQTRENPKFLHAFCIYILQSTDQEKIQNIKVFLKKKFHYGSLNFYTNTEWSINKSKSE